MKYKLIEEETNEVLTDNIEIVRVDFAFFVDGCYNLDVKNLDYKDRLIRLIGIEDKGIAKSITKGEERMEEILGAYDGEWNRQEVARVVMLDKIEKAEEQGLKQGIEN